jgi:ATP-binding cassette, subfamily B, bacterial
VYPLKFSEEIELVSLDAIARVILKNPPTLILDEATSVVDNETEYAIQKSLEMFTVNRTTIAIARRLSTIRNSDVI